MKRIAGISILVGIIVGLYGISAAAEEGVNEVIDKLQANYDRTEDFSAMFTQETISKSIGAPAVMNGKIYIKKPGMMRIDYTDPKKWQIISDGVTSWLYFPDDKQVRIYTDGRGLRKRAVFELPVRKGQDIATISPRPLASSIRTRRPTSYLLVLAPKSADSTIDRDPDPRLQERIPDQAAQYL